MENYNIEPDLEPIIAESRELSIAWKHGFINYDHFFVAMLREECLATNYLGHCNVDLWEAKIKGLYPATSTETINDSLPLTKQAENIIRHSHIIAASINKGSSINTVHMLLAILSYENEVTKSFGEAGLLIEDITTSHFKKRIKQFTPVIEVLRRKNYTRTEALLLSSGTIKKRVDVLYSNALNLFRYGQFEDSAQICRIGLSLSPTNTDLKKLLAYSAMRLRDFESSLALMTELVKEKPGIPDLQFFLSYILDSKGSYNEAAAILDTLLQEQPDNDNFLNNRGFNLFRQEKYAESVPFFEKAIQINPAFAYPWNNLGFAKYKLGETELAVSLIDKSLTLDKGNAFAYKHKGIISMEQGKREDALKNFHLAIKFSYTEKYGDEVLQLLKKLDR